MAGSPNLASNPAAAVPVYSVPYGATTLPAATPTFTVSTTVTALSALSAAPSGATTVVLQNVGTTDVYYRVDGGTLTASPLVANGKIAAAGGVVEFAGAATLAKVALVTQSGTSTLCALFQY